MGQVVQDPIIDRHLNLEQARVRLKRRREILQESVRSKGKIVENGIELEVDWRLPIEPVHSLESIVRLARDGDVGGDIIDPLRGAEHDSKLRFILIVIEILLEIPRSAECQQLHILIVFEAVRFGKVLHCMEDPVILGVFRIWGVADDAEAHSDAIITEAFGQF